MTIETRMTCEAYAARLLSYLVQAQNELQTLLAAMQEPEPLEQEAWLDLTYHVDRVNTLLMEATKYGDDLRAALGPEAPDSTEDERPDASRAAEAQTELESEQKEAR